MLEIDLVIGEIPKNIIEKRQSRSLALFVDEKFFTNVEKCININLY